MATMVIGSLAGELLRHARQRIGEPDQIERRIACRRRRFGARRQRQRQAGDQRSDSERLHRPIGEIVTLHGGFPAPDISSLRMIEKSLLTLPIMR